MLPKEMVFNLLFDVRVHLARRVLELFPNLCGLIHKGVVFLQGSVWVFFSPEALHLLSPRRNRVLSKFQRVVLSDPYNMV
jgi:hypothetical protein